MASKIPSWLWWKRYFDVGLGLTSYMKYAIAIFGLYSFVERINGLIIIFLGIFYMAFCVLIGWIWIKKKLMDKENEISNQLNPLWKKMSKGKKFK